MSKKDIFKIINFNGNDQLGSMDNNQLDIFIKYLNEYMLELRSTLHFPNNVTFGFEIEVENIILQKYLDFIIKTKNCNWNLINDESLMKLVSPILKDDNLIWIQLSNILNRLSKNSEIGLNSRKHIYVGAQILGRNIQNYYNFFKLWAAYENVIFRFGYGDYISESNDYSYANPLLDIVYAAVNREVEWSNLLSLENYALECHIDEDSLPNYTQCFKGNKIEVKNYNGTLDSIVCQNNINFLVKLFLYANSKNFNEELVLNRMQKLSTSIKYNNDLKYYNQLDLEAAIELADLIFNKNIDKVYFLRQYIKNYEIGEKALEKGTKFTKRPIYW